MTRCEPRTLEQGLQRRSGLSLIVRCQYFGVHTPTIFHIHVTHLVEAIPGLQPQSGLVFQIFVGEGVSTCVPVFEFAICLCNRMSYYVVYPFGSLPIFPLRPPAVVRCLSLCLLVLIACRFEVLAQDISLYSMTASDGDVEVTWNVPDPGIYTIEASHDLNAWDMVLRSDYLITGGVTFLWDYVPPGQNARFYRLRQVPLPEPGSTIGDPPTNALPELQLSSPSRLVVPPYLERDWYDPTGRAAYYDVTISGVPTVTRVWEPHISRHIGLTRQQHDLVTFSIRAYDVDHQLVAHLPEQTFTVFFEQVYLKELPNDLYPVASSLVSIKYFGASAVTNGMNMSYAPDQPTGSQRLEILFTGESALHLKLLFPDGVNEGTYAWTPQEITTDNKLCALTVIGNSLWWTEGFHFYSWIHPLTEGNPGNFRVSKYDLDDPTVDVYYIALDQAGNQTPTPVYGFVYFIKAKWQP